MTGPITPIELSWIAWAVSDEHHRELIDARSLGFGELVLEVELTLARCHVAGQTTVNEVSSHKRQRSPLL